MDVYDKLLSRSPFIKSPRKDEYYEPFTDIENYTIDYLIAFFEDMICFSKELGIKPLQISSLAKAVHILYSYGQIEFDGSIRIATTDESLLPAGLNAIVCTIDVDEIKLVQEGYERNEYGGDSFSSEFICIGDHDDDALLLNNVEDWNRMFINNLRAKSGLEIEDYIEIEYN